MAKYKIKHTSIMHNGNLYAEGSTVELTEKQAKRLEDFVTLIPEKKSAENSTKTKTGLFPYSFEKIAFLLLLQPHLMKI